MKVFHGYVAFAASLAIAEAGICGSKQNVPDPRELQRVKTAGRPGPVSSYLQTQQQNQEEASSNGGEDPFDIFGKQLNGNIEEVPRRRSSSASLLASPVTTEATTEATESTQASPVSKDYNEDVENQLNYIEAFPVIEDYSEDVENQLNYIEPLMIEHYYEP